MPSPDEWWFEADGELHDGEFLLDLSAEKVVEVLKADKVVAEEIDGATGSDGDWLWKPELGFLEKKPREITLVEPSLPFPLMTHCTVKYEQGEVTKFRAGIKARGGKFLARLDWDPIYKDEYGNSPHFHRAVGDGKAVRVSGLPDLYPVRLEALVGEAFSRMRVQFAGLSCPSPPDQLQFEFK